MGKGIKDRLQGGFSLLLYLGILLVVNVLATYLPLTWDLTEDKRYTLTSSTRELLDEVDEPVYVEVLLGGSFPAGFKRLQRATREMLEDFRSETPFLDYTFSDPNEGTKEQVNNLREEFVKQGMNPTNLRIKENGETTEKLIFPYAVISYGGRSVPVSLLESEMPGLPPEVILNNSISLLEYKLSSALFRLIRSDKPNIVFTRGHGELIPEQTSDLRRDLRPYYNFTYLTLDSVFRINPEVDLVIVARPRGPFSEPDKFKLDQYIMKGGKVIFLIDPLNATLDSMRLTREYIPVPYDLNLDDLLYRYGARVEPNLVLDLECSRIPLQVGVVGNNPQYDLFSWYYHPAVQAQSGHPMVKNLNRINFDFPASIDTIQTKTPVTKTILLTSSEYSRLQYPPVQIGFDILRYEPDPTKFDKGPQTLALLLEGQFSSNYENRVPQVFLDSLKARGEEFRSMSEPTAVLVVSDGDVIRNPYNPVTNEAKALGYNVYERRQYANKDFALNMIEYLLDQRGLIEARSRDVRLRLLDKVRVEEEKTFWQSLNLALPILLLLLFGFGFFFWRKRRYAS
ncbi:MAG: gliding motility-associated ABC transporter substrate-binding protein GldG [Lewinellaceae bacterium]|nr:gliding motility-associated ABC transporter substrate-binding protein GldG [Saprospiraceae bacterium]MCB9311756.1 gliding motility-associated ABC transporter substrate-binding protein GldG [Lewinellaceae bacterium]HRW75214.1 gliding motility-associated ABC transporter substrate-binding protein GldG [Saprospiraceae bacterium]